MSFDDDLQKIFKGVPLDAEPEPRWVSETIYPNFSWGLVPKDENSLTFVVDVELGNEIDENGGKRRVLQRFSFPWQVEYLARFHKKLGEILEDDGEGENGADSN